MGGIIDIIVIVLFIVITMVFSVMVIPELLKWLILFFRTILIMVLLVVKKLHGNYIT